MSNYEAKCKNSLPIIFDDRMPVNNLTPKLVDRVNNNTEDLKNLYEETEALQEDVEEKVDAPLTPGTAGQVLTSDGEGGSVWASIVSGEIIVDPTLTIQGAAADAKAVGDQFTLVKQDNSECIECLFSKKQVTYNNMENVAIYQLSTLASLQGYKTAMIPVVKGKIYYLVFANKTTDATMAFGNVLGAGENVHDGELIAPQNKRVFYDNTYDFMYITYVTPDQPNATLNVYEYEFDAEQRTDMSSGVVWQSDSGVVANPVSVDYGNVYTGLTGLKCTNYIVVDGMQKIEISIASSNSSTTIGLVFYDANHQPISSKRVEWRLMRNAPVILDVPQNAKYVRTTIRSDTALYGEFIFNELSTNGTLVKYLYDNFQTINKFKKTIHNEILIAAHDSLSSVKAIADYVCDGVNDEIEIRNALSEITYGGGAVVLASGTYNIDSFGTYNGKRIAIPLTTITGSSWRKEVRGVGIRPRDYGQTRIVVSEAALTDLGSDEGYIFSTPDFTYGRIGVFKNFQVYLHDNQHRVTIIDNSQLSGGECTMLHLNAVMPDIANTVNTPMPVQDCVGIVGYCGDDTGSHNIISNCFATGFYEGFRLGGEHLICEQLVARYNYYSYTFGNYDYHIGTMSHPITLMNCCDENSACLPRFVKCGNYNSENQLAKQEVTFINFNLELARPSNFGGGLVEPAVEDLPGAFCGTVTFTGYGASNISGKPSSGTTNNQFIQFWADGSGEGFITRNAANPIKGSSAQRDDFLPALMQQYYDVTLNKMLLYTASGWVDLLGNAV